MTSKSVSVAISSVTAADDPSAGLAAAQTLRNGPGSMRVVALATAAFADGLQSLDAVDEVVIVPSPHVDAAGFVKAVIALTHRRPFVLLAGSARDAVVLAAHRRALEEAGIRHVLPSARQVATLPFLGVSRLGGVKIPRHAYLDPRGPERRLRGRWRFPLTISAVDGRSATADAMSDVGVAVTALDAAGIASIHEAIEGDEFSIAVVGTGGKGTVSVVAARALVRSATGAVWSAVTTIEARVLTAARRTVQAVRWTGPGELHIVQDGAGALWFTGLTPAFPSWISLAEAAGAPLVHEYVRRALGRTPKPTTRYRNGLLMSRVAFDVVAPLDDLGRLAIEGVVNHDRPSRGLRAAAHRQARVRAAR